MGRFSRPFSCLTVMFLRLTLFTHVYVSCWGHSNSVKLESTVCIKVHKYGQDTQDSLFSFLSQSRDIYLQDNSVDEIKEVKVACLLG